MNKKDFAAALAANMNITKLDANYVVDSFLNVLTDELTKGETVKFTGFGIFGTRRLETRKGTNPRTGESIELKPVTKPYFKPGKTLRESL